MLLKSLIGGNALVLYVGLFLLQGVWLCVLIYVKQIDMLPGENLL